MCTEKRPSVLEEEHFYLTVVKIKAAQIIMSINNKSYAIH